MRTTTNRPDSPSVETTFKHLVAAFAETELQGAPKHLRLRNAVLTAIRKGYLKPGDQLPPEQDLSKAVGLSLGTVQRALTTLASERAVTREQGRGTFIAKPELSLDELWQYKFVEAYGMPPLPVSIDLIDRRVVQRVTPWLAALGEDERGYCELTRIVEVNGDFRCLSRIYVRNSRFPKLMRMQPAKIAGNIKKFLADEFGTPTHVLEQFSHACTFPADVCSALKLPRGSTGLLINTVGRSVGQEAITFQMLWVPPGPYYIQKFAARR
jgi:GntR family transcriptional regulator